jgi:hypothetical protein
MVDIGDARISIMTGIGRENRNRREFFDLAKRFRRATKRDEVKRLGDQLGRLVFGEQPLTRGLKTDRDPLTGVRGSVGPGRES